MNKMAVEGMGLRVLEVAVTLDELLPAAAAADQVTPALELVLRRLADLLAQAGAFAETYGRRSFLSRLFRSHWDHVTVRTPGQGGRRRGGGGFVAPRHSAG